MSQASKARSAVESAVGGSYRGLNPNRVYLGGNRWRGLEGLLRGLERETKHAGRTPPNTRDGI